MSEELRPCPFCGGKAEVEETVTEVTVECHTCFAAIVAAAVNSPTNITAVVNMWNIRTSDKQLASAVEVIAHYADEKHWHLDSSVVIDESNRWSLDVPFNEYEPEGNGYDKAAEWLKEKGYD